MKCCDLRGNYTSSPYIRLSNEKEKVKCMLIGKQNNDKDQHFIPVRKENNYNERFELKENLSRDTIKAYNLKDKYEYIGLMAQTIFAYLCVDSEERLIKGAKTTKETYIIKKEKILDNEKENYLLNLKRSDLGRVI
jgi:hypothetical protein